MTVTVKETYMFFSPLYDGEISNIDNLKLEKEVYGIQQIYRGRKLSNKGGWQSENIYHDFLKESGFSEYIKLLDSAETIMKEVSNLWQLTICPTLDNSWCNINYKHSYNNLHYHSGAVFSFVYYVKGDSNSGKIVFSRPDLMEHYTNAKKSFEVLNPYTYSSYYYYPKPGTFLLFPAWLQHGVEANQNDDPRISIAINFGAL